MDENAEIRRALAPLGVEVHSVLAYADSAMYGRKLRGKRAEHLVVPDGYPLHPALEGADVEGFVERELAATEQMRSPRDRIGKRYYLRGLASRLRRDTDAEPRPRCVALRSHIRVLPDGRVPVCQFNTETIGNLRTQSFDDVWHANEAYRQRRWVDACPGCWAECEVIPSAVYTGDILRALL
jgi:MoaA/NifB/PqqE/SkfB family radical SAM enzyme